MQPHTVMLPVEAIHIGKRQRSSDAATEKHILELSQAIKRDGLIHAVVVDKNYELVAGWCRLNAIKLLSTEYYYASSTISPGFIPCVVTHQESERDLYRVELEENLRRRNLSPTDEAMAVATLHRLFTDEQGPEWGETETGLAINKLRGEARSAERSHTEVAESLLIASFASDPEVQRTTSRAEAMKVVKKKLEQSMLEGLGGLLADASGDYSIVKGDCTALLPTLLDEAYNGIITDPPYGIGADSFGTQAMASGHQYEDTEQGAMDIAKCILKEGFRILKPNGHLYLFCDLRLFFRLRNYAESYGWQTFQTPLIWHKVGLGHAPQPGYFSRRYECILFARKGERKLSKSRSDVFEFPALRDKVHAAQKPVELYAEFMRLSFFPGDMVLDPCAGAGTIFKAAKLCLLKAAGIEFDDQYYQICKQVIEELK